MRRGKPKRKHWRTSRRGKLFRAGRGVTIRAPSELPKDISKKEAREVADAYLEEIASHLKKDHPVNVPGLGRFKIRKVPAKPKRKGINPFTKKEQWFKAKPAQKRIKFFPAKEIKS